LRLGAQIGQLLGWLGEQIGQRLLRLGEQIRERRRMREQRRPLLRRLDQMSQQERRDLLYRLEEGVGGIQQELERLSEKERRVGLTVDEAQRREAFRREHGLVVWQIGELKRRLGRDRMRGTGRRRQR
jgi:hypothetical protein